MNYRRGLARVAFAILLPWAAFWGWTYWDGSRDEVYWTQQWHSDMERQHGRTGEDLLFANNQVVSSRKLVTEAQQRQRNAITIGAGVPLALTFLMGVLFWIASGFRGHRPNN
jgi:hypothetical protein